MYCLHPIEVAKYAEKADGTKFRTKQYHFVPCGKCVACLSRRRNEWTYRLTMENEASSYSYFVTLTYDDEHLPCNFPGAEQYFCFRKVDVQNYLKRFRYFLHELNKDLAITYYCISEYGSRTERPHYHMLVFIKNDEYCKYFRVVADALRDCWHDGFTVVKSTNPANIHYVTKYCVKSLTPEHEKQRTADKPFVLCSKKSYLGSGVQNALEVQACADWILNDRYIPEYNPSVVHLNGRRLPMPRIYRDKLGLKGNQQPLSPDPRLSAEKYDKWKKIYLRAHSGKFDEQDFSRYIDARLYAFEQNAIRNQINKLEKL